MVENNRVRPGTTVQAGAGISPPQSLRELLESVLKAEFVKNVEENSVFSVGDKAAASVLCSKLDLNEEHVLAVFKAKEA